MPDSPSAETFLSLLTGHMTEPVWLPVLSGSMAPALLPGDEVLVEPCSWRRCALGEVVVFRDGKTLVAHRLIVKLRFSGKPVLFQQGDGMPSGQFLNPEGIIGRCLSLRRAGTVSPLEDRAGNLRIVRKSRWRLMKHLGKAMARWIKKRLRISR